MIDYLYEFECALWGRTQYENLRCSIYMLQAWNQYGIAYVDQLHTFVKMLPHIPA